MKANKIFGLIIIMAAFVHAAIAQTTELLIQGGTLHLGNGKVLQQGDIRIRGSKIVEVGNQLQQGQSFVVDAKGKHIYPGLICLNSFMGLNEVDAVRATRDYHETGQVNPNARALIAYNTDSKQLPTALFNGVTYLQTVPQGGLISGSSSLVLTKAWNWEDAVVKADDGIHLFWPESFAHSDLAKEEEWMEESIRNMATLFAQAQQYAVSPKPESVNLRFEAMRGLLDGSKRLYIHVVGAHAIIQCLNFMKAYPGVRPVLVGADEAYRVMDVIKAQQVPVVLNHLHRLPRFNHEDADMPYKLPALLMRAGIKVAIGHSGSWESRNLVFNAGTASAYGLNKEEALQCITLNAAEICGIENHAGSIEAGKDATLLVSHGDILDMKSNQLEKVYIRGQETDTEGQQQELWKRYLKKYELK